MKLIKLVKSVKFWLSAFGILCAASVVLAGYVVLPERVEKCEVKIESVEECVDTNTDDFKLMAQRIEDYVDAQDRIEEEREKRYVQQEKLEVEREKRHNEQIESQRRIQQQFMNSQQQQNGMVIDLLKQVTK